MPDAKRIANDDWVDQDLLTKVEAAERLAREIIDATEQLGNEGPGNEAVSRRLRALKEAYSHMTRDASA